MDAQQMQDEAIAKRRKITPEMAAEIKKAVRSGESNSLPPESSTAFDPIASAMAENPGLTRESAERMAEAFGF